MARAFSVSHSIFASDMVGGEAARAYDLPAPVRCELLAPGINDAYKVTAGGKPYMLRVYRAGWRSTSDIGYELRLLLHLQAGGAPVSAPLPKRDGTWLLHFDAPEGPRPGALFTYAPGKVLDYTEEDAFRYGCAAANLHGVMDTFAGDLPRFRLDLDHLLEAPLRLIRPFAERRGNWEFYAQAGEQLRSQIEAAAPLLEQGICHGDLHGHNVHQTEAKQLTFFDFDCGGPGYRAYDLAVYRWAVKLHARSPEPWEAFLRGYRTVREVQQPDLDAIPAFVAIRAIWLLGLYAGQVSSRGTAWVDRGVEWTERFLQAWAEESRS